MLAVGEEQIFAEELVMRDPDVEVSEHVGPYTGGTLHPEKWHAVEECSQGFIDVATTQYFINEP
jgi:hypothetical protein